MNPERKKVRYTKIEDITRRVNRYKARQYDAQVELYAVEQKISNSKLTGEESWRIKPLLRERQRIIWRLQRISTRLARLKDRLGVFLTPELIASEDHSIPA